MTVNCKEIISFLIFNLIKLIHDGLMTSILLCIYFLILDHSVSRVQGVSMHANGTGLRSRGIRIGQPTASGPLNWVIIWASLMLFSCRQPRTGAGVYSEALWLVVGPGYANPVLAAVLLFDFGVTLWTRITFLIKIAIENCFTSIDCAPSNFFF